MDAQDFGLSLTSDIIRTNWVLDYVPKITTISGIVLNLLLMIVVLKRKSHEIGHYRYLICVFALADLLVSLFHFLVEPRLTGWRSTFFLLVLYTDSFCGVLIVLLLQFVYRYLVMKRGNARPWFAFPHVLVWIPIILAILSAWHISYSYISRRDDVSAYANASFFPVYGVSVAATDYAGFFLYTIESDGMRLQWDSIAVMGSLMVLCSISFGVIAFCGYRIYRNVSKYQSSSRHFRVQWQLFKALMLQTTIPVMFLFLPCSVFFAVPIFGITTGKMLTYFGLLSSFFPLLDPIVIVYCVKDYRHMVASFLGIKVTYISPVPSRPSDSKHRSVSTIPIS